MPNKKRSQEVEGKLIHVTDNVFKVPYRRKNGAPANAYYVKVNCFVCGGVYYRHKANYQKGGASICCIECKKKYMAKKDGEEKHKGATSGPILVKCQNHPFARKGWIPKHRKVVEDNIGRFLLESELVHHINMNQQDNRIENLHVFESQASHFLSHGSLNTCVEELLNRGILVFSPETGKYSVVEQKA